MINTIIFDLDGTLLNTLEDLRDSVNYALARQNFPLRTLTEIRSFVGDGIRVLMERAVPQNTDADVFETCFADFNAYYKVHMEEKTAPYNGINEMLENVKNAGFKTAIVTNKVDYAAQDLCKRMFGENIDLVVGSVDNRPNKPAPDGTFYAIETLGSEKENTIFVGDADTDILTAKNAGLKSIGVLWGFRDREIIEEKGAEYIVETVNDLEKLLISLKNG
ncbi:MAG: HAD family hydrolase [Clostridia bacterium]|nr:HAD family hydrolase [Clostridia bacterium]